MERTSDCLSARLRALAFRRCPAQEANAALASVREEYENAHGRAIAYELILPAGDEAPEASLLPRLWVHLQGKRAASVRCPELFAALFHESTLYFVHGPLLLAELLRDAGLAEVDLAAHVAAWSERAEGRSPPRLALAPPEPDR